MGNGGTSPLRLAASGAKPASQQHVRSMGTPRKAPCGAAGLPTGDGVVGEASAARARPSASMQIRSSRRVAYAIEPQPTCPGPASCWKS